MNMMQIVIGAALGTLVAQGMLYGARVTTAWLQRAPVGTRIRVLTSAAGATMIRGLVRYGGVLAVCAAIVTLGIWAVGDYRAAKSARIAASADGFDASPSLSAAPPAAPPAVAGAVGPAPARATAALAARSSDPYADPDFRVQHRAHRGGSAARFEETLVRRSEAKARAELLSETRLHARRSQYDCEASDRAARYLTAGLDVWGFAAWQTKYFPVEGYRGAMLAACKNIKDVVDPARSHWQSTVAQQDQP